MSVPIRRTWRRPPSSGSVNNYRNEFQVTSEHHQLRSKCLGASSLEQHCSMLEDTAIGDSVQRSFSSLDGVPHFLNVNMRVATAMSHFYSLPRTIKAPRGFDLNMLLPEESGPSTNSLVSTDLCCTNVPNLWDLGYFSRGHQSGCFY